MEVRKLIECPDCGKKCKGAHDLAMHRRRSHPPAPTNHVPPPTRRVHYCPCCGENIEMVEAAIRTEEILRS